MKYKGLFIKTFIPSRYSSERKDEMSHYDSGWENSGAFPSSNKSRPIITKNDGSSSSSSDGDTDHIFADEAFDGTFDTLATVKETSRETTSNHHDGLMTMSHSSSETPAVSNTTTAVVRNALKKSKELQRTSNEGRIEKIYPYNMFRSMPGSKKEGQEKKDKSIQKQQGKGSSNTSSGQTPKADSKRGRDDEQPKRSPPVRIAPILSAVQDEPSSVITDDHQHDHNQYVYDYMAEGADVEPPMSIMSARSRRHGGGSKHHMIRHTLPTSQKVSANPTNMLNNIFISIEEERHLHRLTAQHQHAIHNWLLFLPSILLTLLAGLVVLIFEADINFSDDARVYSSIAVGVLCLVSVFWQALCKQMDLGTKSALHDACSVALKRLSEDILLTMSAAETIPAEYVALIGEKYGQAADACPLTIPYKLEVASSHFSDRMILMLQPPMGQAPNKNPKKINLLRFYATAYDELSAEVINSFAFPFAIPNPRKVSETALRNFKSIITKGTEVDRSRRCKALLCPCLGTPDEERSLFDVLPAVVVGDPLMGQSQRSI
jgi:hypothetical protein